MNRLGVQVMRPPNSDGGSFGRFTDVSADSLATSNDRRTRAAERTGDYMFGAHRAFGEIAIRIDAVVSLFGTEAIRSKVV
jgi:hypothetical protein